MNNTKSLGLYLCVSWACLYVNTNKMCDVRNEAERVLEIETGVVQPIIQAAFNSAFVCFHAVFRPSSQGFYPHRRCGAEAATALSVFSYVKVAIFIEEQQYS